MLIAKPFFRENRLKKLLHDLRGAVLGSGGAKEVLEAARAKAEKKKNRWQSSDYNAVVSGIVLVGLSYMLNVVLWFLPRVNLGS